MNAEETRKSVVSAIAAEMEAGSLLAPHVAAEIAETIMQGLLSQEYLIADGKIHTIIQADWKGDDPSGESEAWEVYTHLEEFETPEETDTEEELRRKAGVDEDGAGYETPEG